MQTILLSALVSFIVSIIYSKWHMNNLNKWMEVFFEEETKRIKSFIDKPQ